MRKYTCNYCGRLCHYEVKRENKHDTFFDRMAFERFHQCPVAGVASWKERKPLKSAVAAKTSLNKRGTALTLHAKKEKR